MLDLRGDESRFKGRESKGCYIPSPRAATVWTLACVMTKLGRVEGDILGAVERPLCIAEQSRFVQELD